MSSQHFSCRRLTSSTLLHACEASPYSGGLLGPPNILILQINEIRAVNRSLKMKNLVSVLYLVTLCCAQKTKRQPLELDYRAQKTNSKHCSNLTLVMDNWRFAIMNQVKDLLLQEPSTVLPEYGRIQPLSDALGSLHKEFKALKDHLGKLTSKFDKVEAFVDDIQAGNVPWPSHVARPAPLCFRGSSLTDTPPVIRHGHGGRFLNQKKRSPQTPQG